MKILYLTDQVYLHGGVEKVLSQKANYLAGITGDEVYIVTHNQQNKTPVYTFSQKIKWIDLDVNYKIEKSYFNKENLKKILKHRKILKQVLVNINPDVIISCSFTPDHYFLPFLVSNIPKIKEFHSSRYFYSLQNSNLKSKIFKILNKYVEKNYDQLVVLNEDEKIYYKNKNIAIIPNPSESTAYKSDCSSKKIIAAGRISPVKNFGDLILSFSKIKDDFPDWELHFWGEDYLNTQNSLQKSIMKLDAANQIKFKGVTNDLKKEMQNYSIYAMTSESECFPMVLLEALSVGLPVISYDCPTGPKHIVREGIDSFLIPNKNLDIFTEKLKELMQSEELRKEIGNHAFENVQRFSIKIIMGKWKTLINNLSLDNNKSNN